MSASASLSTSVAYHVGYFLCGARCGFPLTRISDVCMQHTCLYNQLNVGSDLRRPKLHKINILSGGHGQRSVFLTWSRSLQVDMKVFKTFETEGVVG